MASFSSAFSADAFSIADQVGIFTGTEDPSISGQQAPIGSMYLRQDGTLWLKTQVADTGWAEQDVNTGTRNNYILDGVTQTNSINNNGGRTVEFTNLDGPTTDPRLVLDSGTGNITCQANGAGSWEIVFAGNATSQTNRDVAIFIQTEINGSLGTVTSLTKTATNTGEAMAFSMVGVETLAANDVLAIRSFRADRGGDVFWNANEVTLQLNFIG